MHYPINFFRTIDRVLCYRGSGGLYRHTVVLPDYCCFQIPAYIPDEIAVALPANYLTAYFCLFIIGNIKPGNQILIHSCVGKIYVLEIKF